MIIEIEERGKMSKAKRPEYTLKYKQEAVWCFKVPKQGPSVETIWGWDDRAAGAIVGPFVKGSYGYF